MRFEQLSDGSWRYVGTLSARNPHQIVRFLSCTAFAAILWTAIYLGVVNTSWTAFYSGLMGGAVLSVLGGLAVFLTYALWGFGRGIVTGALFEQVIDDAGVRAYWGPPRPVVMSKSRILAIHPARRLFSARVDLYLMSRSWGALNSSFVLWTDEGLTPEEFEELCGDLESRGFG